jgi:hypothetical protein
VPRVPQVDHVLDDRLERVQKQRHALGAMVGWPPLASAQASEG